MILTKVKPRSRPRNRLMVQSSLPHHQVRSIIWLSKSQRSLSVVSIHKGNKCFSSLVSCDLFMFMPSLILAIAYYTARPLQNSNCHNSEIISWIGSKWVSASFEKGFGQGLDRQGAVKSRSDLPGDLKSSKVDYQVDSVTKLLAVTLTLKVDFYQRLYIDKRPWKTSSFLMIFR